MREKKEEKSSYEKVKGGKLTFKGGMVAGGGEGEKKKRKKKKRQKRSEEEGEEEKKEGESVEQVYEVDTGVGHAPDGKKSKRYEELFPVETKRFGYEAQDSKSREEALDERVKKKADRYCK